MHQRLKFSSCSFLFIVTWKMTHESQLFLLLTPNEVKGEHRDIMPNCGEYLEENRLHNH